MKFKIFIILCTAMVILTACSGVSTRALTVVEQQGQAVYNLRCAQCHALARDAIVIGPSMAGIASRAESRIPG